MNMTTTLTQSLQSAWSFITKLTDNVVRLNERVAVLEAREQQAPLSSTEGEPINDKDRLFTPPIQPTCKVCGFTPPYRFCSACGNWPPSTSDPIATEIDPKPDHPTCSTCWHYDLCEMSVVLRKHKGTGYTTDYCSQHTELEQG